MLEKNQKELKEFRLRDQWVKKQVFSLVGVGHLLSGLPRLYERGYSLTPVDISESDYNPTEGLGTEVMNRNRSSLLSACNGSWPCGLHLNRTLKSSRNHITCSFACMRCVFVLLIFLSLSCSLTWPSSSSRLPPCSKLGFAWCFLYSIECSWNGKMWDRC